MSPLPLGGGLFYVEEYSGWSAWGYSSGGLLFNLGIQPRISGKSDLGP